MSKPKRLTANATPEKLSQHKPFVQSVDSTETLTIIGDGSDTTVIDASGFTEGNEDQVFHILEGAAEFEGELGGRFGGGGGVVNQGGTLTVADNSNISSNSTNAFGGGILNNSGGTVTVTDSTISSNQIGVGGDGIANFEEGTVEVSNSNITDNNAPVFGGGIGNNSDMVTVTASNIANNEAGVGGGIGSNNKGTVEMTESEIADNSAEENDGAAFNADSILEIRSSTITGNTAGIDGGAFLNYGGTLTVTDSKLSGNIAESDGDALAGNAEVSVSDSMLSNNEASRYGGAIANAGTLTVTNSELSGNSSDSEIAGNIKDGEGGGLYKNGQLTVNESGITGNRVGTTGGGINNDELGDLILNQGLVSGNTAEQQGDLFDSERKFIGANFIITGDRVWDAGTEVNTKDPADVPFDFAVTGQGTPKNGVVTQHPDFLPPGSGGILDNPDFANSDFTQPGYEVAKITITEVKPPNKVVFSGTGDVTGIVEMFRDVVDMGGVNNGNEIGSFMDVDFFEPGVFDEDGDPVPALVTGFGAIFTDVDLPDSTQLEFFDRDGDVLFSQFVKPDPQSLSFLGVVFAQPVVSKVQITSGNVPLSRGLDEDPFGTGGDLVAMDNFIYGEPVIA